MDKEHVISELESSFHEQFAENQNHHQNILFKLLSIIGAVIVGYGYILHGYKLEPFNYTITEAIIGLIVSEALLIIGLWVVVNTAKGFRRDQLVCYRIRFKAGLIANVKYGKNEGESINDVFPYSFYPFKNKPYSINWMPDFHITFISAFLFFQLLSGVTLITKSIINDDFENHSCIIICLIIISLLISIMIINRTTKKMKKAYDIEHALIK